MKSDQSSIGIITARTCPTCGHHEIGYVDGRNVFHPLRPGDMIQVLEGSTSAGFETNASDSESSSDYSLSTNQTLSGLTSWIPDPVKSNKALSLKYGVLIDQDMVGGTMTPGLYEMAYRRKLQWLISEERFTPLPVILGRFFGVPHLANGSPLEIADTLMSELTEIHKPMDLVKQWLIRQDDQSLLDLFHPKNQQALSGPALNEAQFTEALKKLNLEDFFALL